MLAETGLLHNVHEDSFPAIMPFWLVFRNRISGLPTAYTCGYVPLYLFSQEIAIVSSHPQIEDDIVVVFRCSTTGLPATHHYLNLQYCRA